MLARGESGFRCENFYSEIINFASLPLALRLLFIIFALSMGNFPKHSSTHNRFFSSQRFGNCGNESERKNFWNGILWNTKSFAKIMCINLLFIFSRMMIYLPFSPFLFPPVSCAFFTIKCSSALQYYNNNEDGISEIYSLRIWVKWIRRKSSRLCWKLFFGSFAYCVDSASLLSYYLPLELLYFLLRDVKNKHPVVTWHNPHTIPS